VGKLGGNGGGRKNTITTPHKQGKKQKKQWKGEKKEKRKGKPIAKNRSDDWREQWGRLCAPLTGRKSWTNASQREVAGVKRGLENHRRKKNRRGEESRQKNFQKNDKTIRETQKQYWRSEKVANTESKKMVKETTQIQGFKKPGHPQPFRKTTLCGGTNAGSGTIHKQEAP